MSDHDSANSDCFSLPTTDLEKFLKTNSRDARSGLPLGVCSLLLRYLIPQLELERYVSQRRNRIEKEENRINSGLDGRHCVIHVSGSSVEGFSVPPYRKRAASNETSDASPGQAGAPFFEESDIDIMTEIRFLLVELRPTPGRLYINEARASHPGYARVVLDGPADTYSLSFSVREMCKAVDDGGQTIYCLSNEAVKRPLVKRATDDAQRSNSKVNLSGPAVNLEPRHSGRQGLDSIPDIDIVTTLPLLGHPPAFHQWLERVSQPGAHWPGRQTVENIRRHGRCFVVTTGHVSSKDRDIECRLSFSDPELRLAKTVTPVQRKVYLLVKLLQKCFLSEPKVVVTYHLKTLLFWLLEKTQPQRWSEQTIFEQVLHFLEKIEECLQQRDIPSYFYPSNNLIGHANPKDVAVTLATVRRIRNDPLRYLHGIDEQVWMGFSTLVTLSTLHRPVLSVLHGVEKDIRLKMANSLMRQARQGMMWNILWPLRCADLLRDVYTLLRGVMHSQLGTTGSQRSAHWSSSDWLMLATIAAFAALREEESRWARDVAGVSGIPTEVSSSCKGDPLMEATDVLLPRRPFATSMLKMFLEADFGRAVPLDPVMALKYAQMVLREEQKTADEQSNLSPRVTSTSQNKSKAGKRGAVSRADSEQKTRSGDQERRSNRSEKEKTGAVARAEHARTGAMHRTQSGRARHGDTTLGAPTSETAAPLAPDLPFLTTNVVKPMVKIMNAAYEAAPVCRDAVHLKPTPDRLAGDLLFLSLHGQCPALISRLHVSILETIGYLRRHCPHLACRCAFWLHQLTTRISGWGPEATPSVPLADAPRFLASLPPKSAALLRQPFARAALLPLSALVIFTAVLDNEPFRQQVAQMEIGDSQLKVFDTELQFGPGEDCALDDVVWTSAVMKLCIREMMGESVADRLCEVGLLSGRNKGQRARQILRRHAL